MMVEFSSVRSIKIAIEETRKGPTAVFARLSRYRGIVVQVSNAQTSFGNLFINPTHTDDWIEVSWGEVFTQQRETVPATTLIQLLTGEME